MTGTPPPPEGPRGAAAETDGYAPWLAGARAGDRDAIERLLRRLRPAVLRYCLARLGPHRAEDVTQEVCVSVLSALGRYEDRGLPFGAFAFRIAQRRVADAHRSSARARLDFVAEVPDAADTTTPGPAEVAERRELAGRARALLDQLPPTQREVLLMRVLGGLSAIETGEALGLTAGNVRVLQHRGLVRLRSLARELDDEMLLPGSEADAAQERAG